MKKISFIFLITIFFIPIMTYASVSDEIPPYINIEGIDEEKYNITKTITSSEVIVELTNKSNYKSYSWSFDRDKIKEDTINLNFEIDFKAKDEAKIEKLIGNIDKQYISFGDNGILP